MFLCFITLSLFLVIKYCTCITNLGCPWIRSDKVSIKGNFSFSGMILFPLWPLSFYFDHPLFCYALCSFSTFESLIWRPFVQGNEYSALMVLLQWKTKVNGVNFNLMAVPLLALCCLIKSFTGSLICDESMFCHYTKCTKTWTCQSSRYPQCINSPK